MTSLTPSDDFQFMMPFSFDDQEVESKDSDNSNGQKVENRGEDKVTTGGSEKVESSEPSFAAESSSSGNLNEKVVHEDALRAAQLHGAVAVEGAAATCSISAEDVMRDIDRFEFSTNSDSEILVTDTASGNVKKMKDILAEVDFRQLKVDASMLDSFKKSVDIDRLQSFPDPSREDKPTFADKTIESMTLEDAERYGVQCYLDGDRDTNKDMKRILSTGTYNPRKLKPMRYENLDEVQERFKKEAKAVFSQLMFAVSFMNSSTDFIYSGGKSSDGTDRNVTYRRVSESDAEPMDHYVEGSVIKEKSFASSSVDDLWHGEVLYVIQNHTGKDLMALSNEPGEREILYPPGVEYRVLKDAEKKTDENGETFYVVYVEEIVGGESLADLEDMEAAFAFQQELKKSESKYGL